MNESFIKDFVLDAEMLSKEQLSKVEELIFQKEIDFAEALLELGYLNQENLLRITAAVMGVPKIDLKEKIISLDDYKIIPEPISQKENLICFDSNEKSLSVAFCDTKSLEILESLIPANKELKLFWAERDEILEKVKKYLELSSEEALFRSQNTQRKILKINDFGIKNEKDLPEEYLKDIANDLYTEKFINSLLIYALNSQADFIFFNLSEDSVEISFRIFERNYKIMYLSREVWFSILAKFKYWSDINLFEKYIVKQGVFDKEINREKHDLFLTFIRADLGESLSIQLDKNKIFKTDLAILSPEQRNLLFRYQKKDSGLYLFSGGRQFIKKSLYSFLEFDLEKNKNIYSLEEEALYLLPYIKQISLSKKDKAMPIILNILEDQPDVLALENPREKSLSNILFNYVSLSKKVILSLPKKDPTIFLDNFLDEKKFDRADLVKNLALLIEHVNFLTLNEENREKYFLNKDEEKVIKSFLKEDEIKNIFEKAGFKEVSKKKLSKIDFYTKKTKKGFLKKEKRKENEIFLEREILGLVELGNFLKKEFIKRHPREKTKALLRKEIKKAVLENALLASFMQEIDIKDVLKYLTS